MYSQLSSLRPADPKHAPAHLGKTTSCGYSLLIYKTLQKLVKTHLPGLSIHPHVTHLQLAQGHTSKACTSKALLGLCLPSSSVPSSSNLLSRQASEASEGTSAWAALGTGHPREGRESLKSSPVS